MLRRSSLVLVLLALTLFAAACGGDDESSTTDVESSSSETVVLPAHDVAAEDGAKAHSESDVHECSSMDLEGDTGSAAFGGFQDVSVRGIGCETGRTGILDVYETYDDGAVAAQVDGYDCDVIETYGDGLVTIRCATADGARAFRFTAVPAHKKKRVELVSECGTFGRYYDVSVRGQSCQDGATFLDDTPTSELTAIGEGDEVAVGSETCTTLYVEGRDRTVRCTQGKRALRFNIATKPSTTHPRKYVENPKESSQTVVRKTTDSKPATKHGLSPDVAISCNATGPFDAITASGVNCAAVTTVLTQDATELEAIERGTEATPIGTPPTFSCVRIDKGGETETIKCTATPSGATFRASFIPASAAPPAGGNPPAATAPTGGASADSATPDDATTTSDDGTGDAVGDGSGQ